VIKWILITPHQGLGDHILCNGLYRQFSEKGSRVFISVKKNYYPELSNMLSDLENVTFLRMPNYKSWKTTRLFQLIGKILRMQVVGLGSYGTGFFPQGVRFDMNFYDQAGIDFNHRWDSFCAARNLDKELELFERLGCNTEQYIFLHEDSARDFKINRDLLPENTRVVTPLSPTEGYFLVDYRLVIEKAYQIHVIESSFAAFIESIPIEVPLFAHRYARHHALHDFRHEFTYKKPWRVLT